MPQEEPNRNTIENAIIGFFDIHKDKHPLFRSKEDNNKFIFNIKPKEGSRGIDDTRQMQG